MKTSYFRNMAITNTAHKATQLSEVDQAVRFTEPIGPDHAFYVEFRDVRGDFEEHIVYRRLNVAQSGNDFRFDPATSSSQKVLLETFPFVKLSDRAGNVLQPAYDAVRTFVFKRVDRSLFESEELVDEMIALSGGSPRELLRILGQTNLHVAPNGTQLDRAAFEKARQRLASQTAQYVTKEEWAKLKELKALTVDEEIQFDDALENLLEKNLVMEYNDGSGNRPSPILTHSRLYHQVVLH